MGSDGKPNGVFGVSYFDLNQNKTFEIAIDRYVSAPPENTSACIPDDGYQGISFARVLAAWCRFKHVSPKILLTHAQKEQTAVDGYPGNSVQGLLTPAQEGWTRPLDKVMGFQPAEAGYKWPSAQVAWAAYFSRYHFDHAPSNLPVAPQAAHDGEFLPIRREVGVPGYLGKEPTRTQNRWFVSLAPGIDWESSVFVHTKAAHCLYQYTPEVNKGIYQFMSIWVQFGFDH